MVCVNPIRVLVNRNFPMTLSNSMLVPCGKCISCRIQRTSEWAIRLMLELPKWNYEASFITLTYDDEHLPKDLSLKPKDLTDFWKRLRKDYCKPIRYYACGEYGDKELKYWSPSAIEPHGRPHYHAIVFGFGYNEENRRILKDNWRFCCEDRFDYSKQKKQEQGFAPVTPDDIRYVTGYIQKKLSGDYAKRQYGTAVAPFSRSSRYLGLDYALEHREELEERRFMFEGHNLTIPRYFLKKLNLKSSDFGFEHKVDYLKERGIISDDELSHAFYFKKMVNGLYDRESFEHLQQFDKELHARYNLE